MDEPSLSPKSLSFCNVFPKAPARPFSPALLLALLAALVLALFAVPAAIASPTSKAPKAGGAAAKVTISKVTVKAEKVTVAGRIVPPAGAVRSRLSVALTLSSSGKTERFNAKVDSKWRFQVTRVTRLTGPLTVGAAARIAGKPSGKPVKKRFKGPAAKAPGKSGPGAKGGPGSAGSGTGTAGGAGGSTGTSLVGLFQLEPGQQAVSGAITGSYFRMIAGGDPPQPVLNANSPFATKTYTPLRPGTDGGLSTVEYQPAPSPAFAGTTSGGLPTGNALASRIVQPQEFFGIDFSIVTDPIGRGTSTTGGVIEEPTPLPVVVDNNGQLSGQVAAWTAAWNGLWFTQGAPKPNGTYAGLEGTAPAWNVSGTTALTGTYNAITGHFAMTWQSLIIGGPFGGYSGQWYLEGTFVPEP